MSAHSLFVLFLVTAAPACAQPTSTVSGEEPLPAPVAATLRAELADALAEDARTRAMVTYGTSGDAEVARLQAEAAALDVEARFAFDDSLRTLADARLSDADREALWRRQYEADLRHWGWLVETTRRYGFPAPDRIGAPDDAAPVVLLLHAHPDSVEAAFPLFQREVEAGRMPGQWLAQAVDKARKVRGRLQLYATGDEFDPAVGVVPPKVENLTETNAARIALGLTPLAPDAVRIQEPASDPAHDFRRTLPRDPWPQLLAFREPENAYRVSGEEWSTYADIRANFEVNAGRYREALRFSDERRSPSDRVAELPAGTRAVDAVDAIVERAAGEQVVMVNEEHVAPQTRLLTLDLLEPLYALGFRYFAVETLVDPEDLERAYATRDRTGWLSDEAVFGEVIREAIRLGYTLVPYEIGHDEGATYPAGIEGRQQQRDWSQARNLAARTVDLDPEARVFVHAGLAHIQEEPNEWWSPMAYYFRERTGIDPLTVDQARLQARSAPEYEHPHRRAAVAAGLVGGRPVILTDAQGDWLPALHDESVDVQVLAPPVTYVEGRPDWLAMNGRRVAIEVYVPTCAAGPCLVEVVDPTLPDDAVPYDRVEASGLWRVPVYVPSRRALRVRVLDASGDQVGGYAFVPDED